MSLTGVWNGQYSYLDGRGSVHFVATLISSGSGFSGTSHETITELSGNEVSLMAYIEGVLDGHKISFSKKYDNAPRIYRHTILYDGMLSADKTEIEGAWRIAWFRDTGRFMMIRGTKVDEAVVRKVFEPV